MRKKHVLCVGDFRAATGRRGREGPGGRARGGGGEERDLEEADPGQVGGNYPMTLTFILEVLVLEPGCTEACAQCD